MKSVDLRKHHRQAVFGAAAGLLFLVLIVVAIAASGCSKGGDANASSGTTAGGSGGATNGVEPSSNSSNGNGSGDNASANSAPEKRTAEQVLKDMEATYRKATSYADQAQLHRFFTRDGEPLEQRFDFSVAFVRPNKLRLACYGAQVVSDGQHLYASAPHVPNLVMKVPTAETLTPDDIVRDPQLGNLLMQSPAGPPVQLPLLMNDNTVEQILQDAMSPPKLLPPESIEKRRCNRVEIDTADGPLVLWIDAQSNLIQRMELPRLSMNRHFDQEGEKTTSLVADLHNAQINRPVDENAFKFEVPADAEVSDTLAPVPKAAAVAARSEPTSLKLTKLWTAEDVKDPGNILVIDEDTEQPRIFVFDGWRTVVEVDDAGKAVARHELDIHENAVTSYLRTATDGQGKRYFVASASAQPQLHVFDENWQRVLSFPRQEDIGADGIGDVQIADLAGDGTLELYVGYWGDVGVQGVSLEGERQWRDRSPQYVLHMTTTEPDAQGRRRLLCNHSTGGIMPFDVEGKRGDEITVPNRPIGKVYGADLKGDDSRRYCALAIAPPDGNVALGIDLDGQELWSYTLPKGAHGRLVELIAAGDVTGDAEREWLLPGADGSIHILFADGKPIDKFSHGAALSGLAGAKLGDQHVLLIASALEKPEADAKGVLEAWLVEPTGK